MSRNLCSNYACQFVNFQNQFKRLFNALKMEDEPPLDLNELPLTDSAPEETSGDAIEWWRFVLIAILLILSGAFSGLNLGVLGLETKNLELMTQGPFENRAEEKEASYARRLLPLRRRGNLLLCAILLGNVAVNSLLSILMADLTSGTVGFFTSTAGIVVFGEIVPQAICTRYGLAVGSFLSWLLWILIGFTFVVSFPIAAILDKVLGAEVGAVMNKSRMKKFFQMQESENVLQPSERKILSAALELGRKTVEQVMTPIDEVYMLDVHTVIDREILKEIYTKGYSRIPVYDRDRQNVVGIMMAKDLILFNPDRDQLSLKQLTSIMREMVCIDHDAKLEAVLTYFQKGATHMALVSKVVEEAGRDPFLKKVGLISLEDIIEDLLDAEFEDEYDFRAHGEEIKAQKEQLVALFMERRADKLLSEGELKAITGFLSKYCTPFKSTRIKPNILQELVQKAEVLELEADELPFTHKTDESPILRPETSKNEHTDIQKQANLHIKKYNQRKQMEAAVLNGTKSAVALEEQADKEEPLKVTPTGRIDLKEININVATLNDSMPMVGEEDPNDVDTGPEADCQDYVMSRLVNPILFTRGLPSSDFYLILSGKVMVCSGNEGFMVEQTQFNYLGAESLTNDSYVPDFSAKVIGQARLLRINRLMYRKAVSSISQSHRTINMVPSIRM